MAHSLVKYVCVFCVSGAALVPWAGDTDSSVQELQFNNGGLAAAEFVERPECNPLIKTEPPEGWLPGAGEGRAGEFFKGPVVSLWKDREL